MTEQAFCCCIHLFQSSLKVKPCRTYQNTCTHSGSSYPLTASSSSTGRTPAPFSQRHTVPLDDSSTTHNPDSPRTADIRAAPSHPVELRADAPFCSYYTLHRTRKHPVTTKHPVTAKHTASVCILGESPVHGKASCSTVTSPSRPPYLAPYTGTWPPPPPPYHQPTPALLPPYPPAPSRVPARLDPIAMEPVQVLMRMPPVL